jgi:uncharacterized protein with HEPN domain
MRDDRERLRDVLEAIERIEKYAVHDRRLWQMRSFFRPGLCII